MPILPSSPHLNFEDIKKSDPSGLEYWEARELMPLLDYSDWKNFKPVIEKAKIACSKSGQNITSHFSDSSKMAKLGSGAQRAIEDYKLSRYACYLIAQNGDPAKLAIANAQTYFAIQTRRQELANTLEPESQRLFIREQVKAQNKQLASTAFKAGVSDFGKFNDMGYLGLYGLHIPEIKSKKGIGKDNILDRAGAAELAANLFRITQTEQVIHKNDVRSQGHAAGIHFSVGHKVRQTIKQIGGTMPENLPAEPHIKLVAKKLKRLGKNQQKLLK